MSSRICSTTDSMRKRKRKGEKERKGKKKKEKGRKMDLNKESNIMKSLPTSSYLGATNFFMYQGNQISRHPDKILGIL